MYIQRRRTKWSPIKDTMHEVNQHLALAEKIQDLIGLRIRPISSNIWGWMNTVEETQQCLLARWRANDKCRLSTKSCPGGFTCCWMLEDLVCLPGTDLSRFRCWGLVWWGEVPQILIGLYSRYETISIILFVPLFEGSTLKNVSDGLLKEST